MNPSDNNYSRRVVASSLLILAWLTFAPLMFFINSKVPVLSKKQLLWLNIFSPLTGTVLSLLILIYGLPHVAQFYPGLAESLHSFPEVRNLLNPPYDWSQMILSAYFLPVYSFCVAVLFVTMAITGWSYIEASIYVCQLGAPLVCMILAIFSAVYVFRRYTSGNLVTVTGSLFLLGFIGLQGLYALACLIIFIFQLDYIHLLTTKEFFDMVVSFLMDLGTATHTNYICANIMVYIMPPVLILLTDYLMWCAAYLCKHMEIKAGPLANRLISALGPLKRVLKTEFRQE